MKLNGRVAALLELGAKFVEEQRADDFEDVALAGVVRPNLPALFVVHDGLKERAENGGRDARPIFARAGKQSVAHFAVEIGKAEMFAEQVAIDVGKLRERFVGISGKYLLQVYPKKNIWERQAQEEVQKITDRHIQDVDKALAAKEAELMEI